MRVSAGLSIGLRFFNGLDARTVHEVNAEELDQAHARGDGEEVRRHHDADARVER